jgi:hypothetical protein
MKEWQRLVIKVVDLTAAASLVACGAPAIRPGQPPYTDTSATAINDADTCFWGTQLVIGEGSERQIEANLPLYNTFIDQNRHIAEDPSSSPTDVAAAQTQVAGYQGLVISDTANLQSQQELTKIQEAAYQYALANHGPCTHVDLTIHTPLAAQTATPKIPTQIR